MTFLYAIAGVVLALAGIGIVALERERRVLISDLREANRKLYADNQTLIGALCAANGQPVTLSDPAIVAADRNRVKQVPYWKSKTPTFEP